MRRQDFVISVEDGSRHIPSTRAMGRPVGLMGIEAASDVECAVLPDSPSFRASTESGGRYP